MRRFNHPFPDRSSTRTWSHSWTRSRSKWLEIREIESENILGDGNLSQWEKRQFPSFSRALSASKSCVCCYWINWTKINNLDRKIALSIPIYVLCLLCIIFKFFYLDSDPIKWASFYWHSRFSPQLNNYDSETVLLRFSVPARTYDGYCIRPREFPRRTEEYDR